MCVSWLFISTKRVQVLSPSFKSTSAITLLQVLHKDCFFGPLDLPAIFQPISKMIKSSKS
ncbi:hypothetical protein PanWU01x14_035420 [Parasponia andersonii]|uniref:Uncharacterized protein n=1 Tax=Parasponia andersonii TaxID=3476 RepID=A0A2P5DT86_PARAD|nr:hypothetical protein PanWU01x14_035420 [Parasponia andersonii]